MGGQLEEFFGSEGAPRKTCLPNGSFKVIHFIDSNAHRGMSRAFRLEVDHSPSLHYSVDITSKFLSIVNHGDVVPDVQRMKLITKQERFIGGGRVHKSIEAPLVTNHANFEQNSGIGIFAGFSILFGEMKPALLLCSAALRTENRLECKNARSRERVFGNEKRVVDSIELDRLPFRGVDDLGMADDKIGRASCRERV